jgi:hypothetical protein
VAVWFPDGGKLLGIGYTPEGADIWMIPMLGAAAERMVCRFGTEPAISPDYLYDDTGLQIGETEEHYSRRFGVDENGGLQTNSEESHKHHLRFEHVLDAQGNWTERVVWSRLEPNPNFERSNVERREISYH